MNQTILDRIQSPGQLHRMRAAELEQLARELRSFLLESVAATGGHLASNLGVVELTIALHHVFDAPRDRLLWDVGHQAYGHKVLTGRREKMHTLRAKDGLAGFTVRGESAYDSFGAGHAGTAISAAVGMAMALGRSGPRVVAVVGDGALSAGMAFEGLNHAGALQSLPLTIVLNDNGMSISPALGGLHNHLRSLVADWHGQRALPAEEARHPRDLPNFFATLGLDYTGPIDGHDLGALVMALRRAREAGRPQVVHVVTTKGKGYGFAEADPVGFHGTVPFDLATGRPLRETSQTTFSTVFGGWICDAAKQDRRVFAITPAMREGSALVDFERQYPGQYVDAAIAEQHAVTLAAGLAAAGARPVLAIYSTFLQRAYDQVIHDVALQNLPVLFAVDRAGISGGDGATHLGGFDIAALRCIPNLVIMTPADGQECYRMLSLGLSLPGPSVVRYPRASCEAHRSEAEHVPLIVGTGEVLRRASRRTDRVALLAFGPLLSVALEVGRRIDATVVNMRFAKPLDVGLLQAVSVEHGTLVSLEEGVVAGGAGSACAEVLAPLRGQARLLRLGLPDAFVGHGERAQLLACAGLDADGVEASVLRFMRQPAYPLDAGR